VLNTTGTVDSTEFAPQGNMSGHGISVGQSNRFSRSFEEHGYIIGIISVLPRTAYQQGVPRLWRRETKYDYYWPEFANLGEQEIKQSELYYKYNQTADSQDETFGYQQRYAEYKYCPSVVHGKFKTTLDFWHLGRKFAESPNLNATFVTSDPDSRIFAVTDPDEDKLYVQIFNRIDAIRPMPIHGIPQL